MLGLLILLHLVEASGLSWSWQAAVHCAATRLLSGDEISLDRTWLVCLQVLGIGAIPTHNEECNWCKCFSKAQSPIQT